MTVLGVYRRQPQLGAFPDGTIPGFDLQGTERVERILGNAGLHCGATDDAIHCWCGGSMPADTTDTDEGIGFRHIIDQGGIRAIGIARFLEHCHCP